MDEERTYTLDEIEERTGFDKRTIAYYVQEGLLPKVGRRGPRTRYSRQFLDRLLFIKKTRDLQDQGLMGSMTLGEIKDLFDEVPDWTIHNIVTGKEPLHVVDNRNTLHRSPSMSSPRNRARAAARHIGALHDEVQKDSEPAEALHSLIDLEEDIQPPVKMSTGEDVDGSRELDLGSRRYSMPSTGPGPEAPPPLPVEDELRMTLTRLQRSLETPSRSPASRGPAEHWTRMRVTSEIFLSAQDLGRENEELLEKVANLLGRLIREAGEDR